MTFSASVETALQFVYAAKQGVLAEHIRAEPIWEHVRFMLHPIKRIEALDCGQPEELVRLGYRERMFWIFFDDVQHIPHPYIILYLRQLTGDAWKVMSIKCPTRGDGRSYSLLVLEPYEEYGRPVKTHNHISSY